MKFLLILLSTMFIGTASAQERAHVLAVNKTPVELSSELIRNWDQRLSVACVNNDANVLFDLFSRRSQEIRIKQGDLSPSYQPDRLVALYCPQLIEEARDLILRHKRYCSIVENMRTYLCYFDEQNNRVVTTGMWIAYENDQLKIDEY